MSKPLTFHILPCVTEYVDAAELYPDLTTDGYLPTVRRPEPDESPEYFGVYCNDGDYDTWLKDFATEEEAEAYKENQESRNN